MISALEREYQPLFMPSSDYPPLVELGAGNADIDARISAWFATARALAMAYRRSLKPQTERFERELAEFDRYHAETLEPRRSLIWRLPALPIAINRLLYSSGCEQPVLWRCYALHLADFDQLKATVFSSQQANRELAYGLMAGSFIKAATRGTP
jgi:hypothetical protein